MKQYERLMAALSLSSVALLTMGVNRCQESYNFAAQSTLATATTTGSVVTGTPTETATGAATVTGTVTPGRGTATVTPAGSATPSGSATPAGTVTGTVTATPTDDGEGDDPAAETRGEDEFFQISAKKDGAGAGVLGALSQLSDEEKTPAATETDAASPNNSGSASGEDEAEQVQNWLGRAYASKSDDGSEEDSDGDTYSDYREDQFGTDPRDPNSFPPVRITTDLSRRLSGVDDDGDGLSNQEEALLKTDPNSVDSDGDGIFDGAEIRSSTDPLKRDSVPVDSDGDGLSDQFERSRGLDWRSIDSDGDGLRDDLELAMGTDITLPDSDGDGIPDGKEVAIGSDPTIAEQ